MVVILHNIGPFPKFVVVHDDNANAQVFAGNIADQQDIAVQIAPDDTNQGNIHYTINGGPSISDSQLSEGHIVSL